MRKLILPLFAIAAVAGLAGCAGPEQKLSRGVSNTLEVVRWGDMRRNVEQNAVFSAPDINYTYGIVHGFNQSVCRIGIGLYETVTFPIPSYDPLATNYLPVKPQYPSSYKPGLISGSSFDTDTYTGFGGGTILPILPGNRFQVFDN